MIAGSCILLPGYHGYYYKTFLVVVAVDMVDLHVHGGALESKRHRFQTVALHDQLYRLHTHNSRSAPDDAE